MKTVSTKLENNLHRKFIELCNKQGKCQSEFLRDTIENILDNVGFEENGLSMPQGLKQEHYPKPPVEAKIKRISYDDGKTWIDVPEMTNVSVSD